MVEVVNRDVDAALLARVPRALARKHGLLPLEIAEGILRVAASDPTQVEGLDDLSHLLGLPVERCLAPADEISRAIDRVYSLAEAGAGEFAQVGRLGEADGDSLLEESGPDEPDASENDAPVIRLVQQLIADAVERGASDIHLEPLEHRFRVRLRIDGVLVEADSPPQRLQRAVVSRVKIMANISIAEKRLPQDGRIQLRYEGRALDFRVSTLPTAHGESVVMRVLDKENVKLGLPELGFAPDDEELLRRLVALPDGVVLVTGPTGSGKTTTLYGCLHHLNKTDRKIITAEDPVEYQLTGINQVPVRTEIGMTFGAALRAMLRQAPNVIMVGEIRDLETAEIAVNASLTGHMVFSTLHTNDAPGAVARLIDLGVKPFLLAASLRAVLAQRLVRKLCLRCREAYEPTPADLMALGMPCGEPQQRFMRAVGCAACRGTGYRGRIGIFEIFVVNEEIQQLIHGRAGLARMRSRARANGMRTLREDGVRKVSAGLTTVEEVVSITAGDVLSSSPPHTP